MPPGRDAAVVALLALMEWLASYPLLSGTGLLDGTALGGGSMWLVLIAGMAGCSLAFGLTESAWGSTVVRLCLVSGGLATAGALTVLTASTPRPALVTALLLGTAYWRGLKAAEETATHERVRERLDLGFALLLLGFVVTVARGSAFHRPAWTELALSGIAYVGVALTALAVSRIAPHRYSGTAFSVAACTALYVAALGALGMLALGLMSVNVDMWLAHALAPLGGFAGSAASSILAVLLAPLFGLLDLVRHHLHTVPQHPAGPAPHPLPRQRQGHGPPVPDWLLAVRDAAALAVALAMTIGLWLALPRISARRRRRVPGTSITEGAGPSFWQALRARLQGLWHRGNDAVTAQVEQVRQRLSAPHLPQDPVRRLYAQLLSHASSQGLERSAAVTPVQFECLLVARWPDGAADFATVTAAYTRRRYGEAALDQAEVQQLRAAWERLRRVMRAG